MAGHNPVTGAPDFVEVIDENTGLTQQVPREWLEDPILGRSIARTNTQLALDHELPAPPSDAKVADLRDYAIDAGIDVDALGLKTKADYTAALEPFLAAPVDEDTDDSDTDPSETNPNNTPAAGAKE